MTGKEFKKFKYTYGLIRWFCHSDNIWDNTRDKTQYIEIFYDLNDEYFWREIKIFNTFSQYNSSNYNAFYVFGALRLPWPNFKIIFLAMI